MAMMYAYKIDRKGLPVPGSMIFTSTYPPKRGWAIVRGVIGGASPIQRRRFRGTNRYFVLLTDEHGTIIPSSLFAAKESPLNPHLELFANNIITISDDNARDSGAVIDSPEDSSELELLVSEEYLQNGYKYSFIKATKEYKDA